MVVEEGANKNVTVKMRKRSSVLLRKARKRFKELDRAGRLRCEVCGYVKPESIMREIVHIHHTEPLMEVNEKGMETLIDDAIVKMVPLCPTCHSLSHSKNPPLTIEQILNL